MDVPLTLPDRQTIYMLQYLVEHLNADPYLARENPGLNKVVSSVLARWPIEKKSGQLRIHEANLPCLALYTDTGTAADLSVNTIGVTDTYHLEYLMRIPQTTRDYDGMAVALAWIRKVYWRAIKWLYARTSLAMCTSAGIRDIRPGKWDARWYPTANIVALDGQMLIDHLESPCQPEELATLREIAVTLDLYDQDDVDTGFDLEATIDPGS